MRDSAVATETQVYQIHLRPRAVGGRVDLGVETNAEVDSLIAAGAPVAIGVSGGKDSCAAAIATVVHLDSVGHAGPRILIHSDLGTVEWRDSLPTCERLAAHLGLELVVVRRAAGDMMGRWETRWENSKRRYADLSCVRVILPWSTPAMRFCTSELKSAVIAAELVRRFPGQAIVSASGVRRDESDGRADAPTCKVNPRLASKRRATRGVDWNPIAAWLEADVYAFLAAKDFALHEGYTKYGMSRISCVNCIMSSADDLRASSTCPDNHPVTRRMVALEVASTFAFQGARWLGDVRPEILGEGLRAQLADAQDRARRRVAIEARIPRHLLYTKGWPHAMPTRAEAELLAEVRREVAALLGFAVRYTDADGVLARFAELLAAKAAKDAAEAAKAARKAARAAKTARREGGE
jgi:3'-phosphoadenosine 5'-phosphosulfate sulfotransferase (PAPS reductase)/FAD synthetase